MGHGTELTDFLHGHFVGNQEGDDGKANRRHVLAVLEVRFGPKCIGFFGDGVGNEHQGTKGKHADHPPGQTEHRVGVVLRVAQDVIARKHGGA